MVGRSIWAYRARPMQLWISQAVSSLMLFIYIKVKVPYLRLSLPELHIDMDFLKNG